MHDGIQHIYHWKVNVDDVDAERQRFRAAVDLARRQVMAIKKQAEQRLGKDHAYIFDAHLLLLEDKKLTDDVEQQIIEHHANAEWAVKVVGDRLLSLYSEIKDEYLRERGSDIEDVMQRLVVALSGAEPQPRSLSEDAVVVSQDLLPSALAELDLDHARALATDTGGWTSHTAILARGIGIPAVVGLRDFYRRTRTGDRIIVDSNRRRSNPAPFPRHSRTLSSRGSESHPRPSGDRGQGCRPTSNGRRHRSNTESKYRAAR